jgi:hypothetical protein
LVVSAGAGGGVSLGCQPPTLFASPFAEILPPIEPSCVMPPSHTRFQGTFCTVFVHCSARWPLHQPTRPLPVHPHSQSPNLPTSQPPGRPADQDPADPRARSPTSYTPNLPTAPTPQPPNLQPPGRPADQDPADPHVRKARGDVRAGGAGKGVVEGCKHGGWGNEGFGGRASFFVSDVMEFTPPLFWPTSIP